MFIGKLQSWPKVLGHFAIFLIQKCIRRTKHLTLLPSPPPPPHPNNVESWSQNAPCRFQQWLREVGGVGGGGRLERKIFFRVFGFLRWWNHLVWMCSVPRTFGHDCSYCDRFTGTVMVIRKEDLGSQPVIHKIILLLRVISLFAVVIN